MVMTKTDRLFRALANGDNVSVAKLRAVTRLENLSSTVHRLRENGLPIYTNKRRGKTYYRLAV